MAVLKGRSETKRTPSLKDPLSLCLWHRTAPVGGVGGMAGCRWGTWWPLRSGVTGGIRACSPIQGGADSSLKMKDGGSKPKPANFELTIIPELQLCEGCCVTTPKKTELGGLWEPVACFFLKKNVPASPNVYEQRHTGRNKGRRNGTLAGGIRSALWGEGWGSGVGTE